MLLYSAELSENSGNIGLELIHNRHIAQKGKETKPKINT